MKPTKQQWLLVNHDLPIREAISKFGFERDSGLGFELIETTSGLVRARFIERVETTEEINSPFGEAEQIRLVRYVDFVFVASYVSHGVSLVKLIRPPVSIKGFVNALMVALEYTASLKKLRFDIQSVYSSIAQDEKVDRLAVSKLIVSQIPLGSHATSRMEITSPHNALLEFSEVYTAPAMKIDKISISARIEHKSESLELTAAGSICCTPGLEAYLERTIFAG